MTNTYESRKKSHFVAKLDGVNKARKSCEDYTIVTELQKYVFSCHKILNFLCFVTNTYESRKN